LKGLKGQKEKAGVARQYKGKRGRWLSYAPYRRHLLADGKQQPYTRGKCVDSATSPFIFSASRGKKAL
jgi:hypothetical protein